MCCAVAGKNSNGETNDFRGDTGKPGPRVARRRDMKLGWLAAVAAFACLTPAAAQEPKPGGELRVAISGDITSSEPGVRRSGDADTILHHVVEALVAYREDLSIAPMLAESYAMSPDGRSYTFKLRDGITFHNGAPMTSADVKWSWDRMLDPATRWQCRGWYDGSQDMKVEAIETPDPKTVVFRLAAPSALFLHYVANIQCMTAILHRDSVNAAGEWQDRASTRCGPQEGCKPSLSIRSGTEVIADTTPSIADRSSHGRHVR